MNAVEDTDGVLLATFRLYLKLRAQGPPAVGYDKVRLSEKNDTVLYASSSCPGLRVCWKPAPLPCTHQLLWKVSSMLPFAGRVSVDRM